MERSEKILNYGGELITGEMKWKCSAEIQAHADSVNEYN